MVNQTKIDREHEESLANQSLPNIYFNGFVNGLATGDISIILKRNGSDVAILNTSYTVAKTLAIKLGELVAALEEATGESIMTVDDIAAALTGSNAKQAAEEENK